MTKIIIKTRPKKIIVNTYNYNHCENFNLRNLPSAKGYFKLFKPNIIPDKIAYLIYGTLFLKGLFQVINLLNGIDLALFIEKVIFNLHVSFIILNL